MTGGGKIDPEDTVDDGRTRTLTLDGFEGVIVPPRYGALPMPERYVDRGFLASGAMGEVRRVLDRHLGTEVAMKLIRPDARAVDSVQRRFRAEARLTAQLRHPHIVAVHDSGVLPDGRLWFTMELIEGETLDEVAVRVHEARSSYEWRPSRDGWTLRGLIEAFGRVCDAVALAHARGVLHRDLKPRNIMVGPRGYVKVMDWGIARGLGYDLGEQGAALDAFPSEHRTILGSVIGTPAYMAPEQARGQRDAMTSATDVYALGAVLYFLLVGQPPYRGEPASVVDKVRVGPPPPIRDVLGSAAPPLPERLVALCERAMARDPADRYPSAGEVADEVRSWLLHDERAQVASALVRRVADLEGDLARLSTSGAALRQSARTTLANMPLASSPDEKAVGWQLLRYADDNTAELRRLRSEAEEMLWAATTVAPGYGPARAALGRFLRDALVAAERDGRASEALERELLLRSLDLPEHADFVARRGWLTIDTAPSGARVDLYRYEVVDRRWTPVFERTLGTTPLRDVEVGAGAWSLRLHADGHEAVTYPIFIDRGAREVVRPPDGAAPLPIPLPRIGEIPAHLAYVPPGWAQIGGREGEEAVSKRRLWFDGLLVDRVPLTVDGLVALAQSVLDGGGALPRWEVGAFRLFNHTIQVVERGGRAVLADPTDARHGPAAVIVGSRAVVDWILAARRARDGAAWRLLGDVEWERVARGADGRRLPWGDSFEPTFGQLVGSFVDPAPVAVGSGVGDVSPYGVVDLMSTANELTGTPWFEEPPPDGARVFPRGDPPPVDLVLKGGNGIDPPPWSLPEARIRYLHGAERPWFLVRFGASWPPPGGAR